MLVIAIFVAFIASATSSSDDSSPLECVPLIKFANAHDAKLEVIASGVNALVAQQEQRQSSNANSANIEVIAVVGGYRLGKSFLLNALTDSDAFPVGHTVNAHTAAVCGIVMSTGILVLDTPGLFSPLSSEDRDAALVSLVMAVSSAVLVLGDGAIDQRSVERLSLLIEFANKRSAAAAVPRRVFEQKPALVWVLRNMMLQLESANGTPLSASRYVVDTFAQTHAPALADFFAPVEGVALPFPVESTLEIGPKMSRRRTSAAYSAAIGELRRLLLSVVEGKWRRHQAIIDKPMTIVDFGTVAAFWTDELSSSFANSTLFDSSASIRAAFNEHVGRQALQLLRSSFKERRQGVMNKVQLQAWFDAARVASLAHHARHVVGVDTSLTSRFVEQLEHVFAMELSPQNELMVQQHVANATSDALMAATARLTELIQTLPKDEAILRAETSAISAAAIGQLQTLVREFGVDLEATIGVRLASVVNGIFGENERISRQNCDLAWKTVEKFNDTQLPLRALALRASIKQLESDFEHQCLGPSQKSFGELKRKLIDAIPAYNDALAQQQLDEFFDWLVAVLALMFLVSFVFLVLLVDWTLAFQQLLSPRPLGEKLRELPNLFTKNEKRVWARCFFYSIVAIVTVAVGGILAAHLWCVAPIQLQSRLLAAFYSVAAAAMVAVTMAWQNATVVFMSPSPQPRRRSSSAAEPLSPGMEQRVLNFTDDDDDDDRDTATAAASPSPSTSPAGGPGQSARRRRR